MRKRKEGNGFKLKSEEGNIHNLRGKGENKPTMLKEKRDIDQSVKEERRKWQQP